ncbi:MAG: autotransporter domain-containing protein [Planctomycetaceae bacterium]|jgi:autotransporter-associated beta strand protein|nr:autotransporter domain-containing protein [Planctomycetaceae bacterium]
MTQKLLWFTSIVALLMIVAAGFRTVNATDYHIGVGQQYATLEEFRLAREAQGSYTGSNAHLMDGDRLILHEDDHSLTQQLYVGYDSSVTVLSNDVNLPRSISPAANARTRLFYLDGSGNHWSKIYFEGINNISGGYSSYDGGAIYAWWHNDIYSLDGQGVTFQNNIANGVGGAIYYWDALNCDLTDSNFIDNKATGSGGALFINASGTLVMSDTTNITLGASEGKTSTFSGNRDQVSLDANRDVIPNSGTPNSIDFTGYSGNKVNLFIKTAVNGVLDMQDPFRTNASSSGGGYSVNIEKSGPGTWKLGGNSIINGSNGTTVSIQEGTLELYQGASLNAIGYNDEFNVARDARVLIHGDNTITGTRVLFQPGAFLTFDLSYYFPNNYPAPAQNTGMPMLNLSGATLQVSGTRIDITGLPYDVRRNGDYVLIQGTSPLEIGDFNLWIGNANIDVSGRVSDRFGYSLGYGRSGGKIIDTQLVLSIKETDNTILRWVSSLSNYQWSVIGKNWSLIRDDSTDSFVPGDTVQFFDSGYHTIELRETVAIGRHSVIEKATGQTWYGEAGDRTGMHVSGDGSWTFNGNGSITDNMLTGSAALLFDGSGTLTLANSGGNTYSGGTNLAGTGTLKASQGNQLGLGNINFLNNKISEQNKLQITGTTTLNQQIVAENGSNGIITVDNTKNLTFQRIADVNENIGSGIYVKNGGKLAIQAVPQGRYGNIFFNGNGTVNDGTLLEKGAAVYVENGGTLLADKITVSKNKVQTNGGIIYNEGTTTIQSATFTENIGSAASAVGNSNTIIRDSTFTKNLTDGNGAAVYYQGSNGNSSSLTISATANKTTTFSGNLADRAVNGGIANSIYLSAINNGTANLIIETEKDAAAGTEGIVNMLDPISSDNTDYQLNITKTGGGTWKLADNNNFEANNGTTFRIADGTVDLYKTDENNGIKAGNIEITKGTFNIETAGKLNSRGENSVTAQTINLANGATLGFDLTHSVSTTSSELTPSPALLNFNAGTLNFNGRQQIDLLALSKYANGYGTFNLLASDTTMNANAMDLLYHGENITELRQRVGELLTADNGKTLQVKIFDTNNGVTTWTGNTENFRWDATSKNWDGKGNIDDSKQFLHGDTVIFTNEGSGKVTIIDGGVEIKEMIVDNSPVGEKNNDYVFTGGSIKGTDDDKGLFKTGSGTVTFTQENTFKGGTIIEGGKVIANKVSSLGTGNVEFRNNNTALEFNLDGQENGVFAQKISGQGALIKSGGSSLTLKNANNTYSGGTIILGGTLIAEGLNTLGSGNIVTGINANQYGTFILNLTQQETLTKTISGTGSFQTTGTGTLTLTQVNDYSGDTIIGNGTTIVAKNINSLGTGENIRNDGTLILDLASDGTLDQTIIGNGNLEKRGNGLLEWTQTNTSELTKSSTFYGKTTLSAGTLRLINELTLQNSLLDYQNGNLDIGTLKNLKLGGIAGTQDLSLNNQSRQPIDLTLNVASNQENPRYGGNITGSGSVTKTGSGTQIFAGQNTYSGGTVIDDGRLVSIGVAGLGTDGVVNNAELEFNIYNGKEETYEKQITGTGSLWKSGSGTLKLIGENDYQGDTIIENGQIAVSSINSLGNGSIFMRNENASLLFDLDEDTTFLKQINGTGSFYKAGTGALTFEQDVNIAGTTYVQAGTLFVNAQATSAITVFDGATLGGRGVVNNDVRFKNGSSHSIGQKENAKLTAFTAKNIIYENNSTVYIKVGKNGSDQVIAKDGFNFAKGGGSVNVVLLNLGLDDFDPETTVSPTDYTIFVADGGKLLLNGTSIGNTESNSDTLTIEGVNGEIRFTAAPDEGIGVLGYSVNTDNKATRNITLSLAAVSPAAVAYLNGNQRAVLQGIANAEVFDGIYAYNKETRGAVIDQTMPMIQTAMPFLTERSVTQFNLATFDRLRFLREPLALTDREINAYRGTSRRLAHIHSRNNYLWFQNFGDFIRMNANNGAPEFQVNSYGFSVGVDRGINYHSSVGLGMGGYFSDLNANNIYQKGDVGSYLISLYGNWVNDDHWMITGSTGFVFSSYELTRNAPTFDAALNSSHSGTTLFASIEGSKKILFGKYEVSPYLGADLIWLCEEGYREHALTGLPSLALNVKSQSTFSVLSTAGIRLGRSMRLLGGNIVNPSLYAAWIHNWTESDIATTASFFGEPSFKIHGASMNRDRAQLGVNLNMTLNKRTDMFARFNAELATRYSDLSFHLGIRFGF